MPPVENPPPAPVRLISPNRLRIYPNPSTGAHYEDAGPLAKKTREGANLGQADLTTIKALMRLGWLRIQNPAIKTDENGWIIHVS